MAVLSAPPPYAATGRKLGRSVLGYVLGVIAVITLEPFTFRVPSHVNVMLWDSWFDPVANVVLFVPAGFLYALTWAAMEPDPASAPARRRLLVRSTTLGALASLAIEITQVFEPTRYPSPTDLLTNSGGTLLGAWLFLRAARRLGAGAPIVGRLALELPLMGLVYLLVPLCSLAALTVAGGGSVATTALLPTRGVGLAALALFGGTLLGQIQRRHFGPTGTLSRRQTALVAAAWFGASALPALATAPIVLAAGIAMAAAAAWSHGSAPDRIVPFNRRFELAALGRAVPWLAAYLALVPLTEPADLALFGKLGVLRRVESLAAFTVLGYVLAEAWGRLELRYRWTAWRVGAVSLVAAVASEALRRMATPSLDWGPAVGASVVSAAYGGWIYHLQRAHVRELVAARTQGRAADRSSNQPPDRRLTAA